MLAHLKIIWQLHAVHQIVSRFFGSRYIGNDFFLGPNLVSFNLAFTIHSCRSCYATLHRVQRSRNDNSGQRMSIELSFLAKSQKLTFVQKQKFLSVCQKRFNKLKNINKQANKMTFITHGFRASVVSDTREGTRLRITFALYVKKIFIS